MKQSKNVRLRSYEDHLIIENFSSSTIKAYHLGSLLFLELRELHSIEGNLDQDQMRRFILHKYNKGAKWLAA